MSFEKILESLNSMPAEQSELKTTLLELVKGLNQEKGKASADILKYKKDLEELTDKFKVADKQNGTYQEIAELLKKSGVDAKNADELMAKMNIKKSMEDENKSLKELLKTSDDKVKGFESQQQKNDRIEKIKPLFEKSLAEFIEAKQKEGKANYNLTDSFVDKETLYKEVDVDNDTLRNDHFSKVLQEADKAQEKFIADTGMNYTKPVHKQGTQQGHYQSGPGINGVANEALENVQKNQGSMESVTNGIAELHASQAEQNS